MKDSVIVKNISPVSLTLAKDSVSSDSIAAEPVVVKGIVLVDPDGGGVPDAKVSQGHDMSWVLLAMFALFALLCFRVSRNTKFVKSLLSDLTSLRDRGNMFDDTVREKSFLVMLSVMCAMTTAILLYEVTLSWGVLPPGLPAVSGMLMCLVATGLYCCVMPLVYLAMGRVFGNAHDTRLWMRGFTASQGMLGLLLFPLALAELFYPTAGYVLIPLSLALFAAIKILFICKGFRIFFTDYSSWVIFFYYLCSLEIVPLILTYLGALGLCRLMA